MKLQIYRTVFLFFVVYFGNTGWIFSKQSSSFDRRNKELIDQTVATVNKEIITQSDLLWLLTIDPTVDLAHIEIVDLQRVLSNKIDRILIGQEAKHLPNIIIGDEEVKNEQRKVIARFSSEMIFRQRIESTGITSQDLYDLAKEQIEIEKYTDFRFRSFVVVTDEEIKDYYNNVLRPKILQQGEVLPEQISSENKNKIEQILLEERITNEISRWLEATRMRAEIIPLASFASKFGK